jgi:hypothetical protein
MTPATYNLWVAGLLSVVLLAVWLYVLALRRRAAVNAMFARAGFTLVRKPDRATRASVWSVFEPFTHLKRGMKKIEWVARGTVGGREVLVMRHVFFKHMGDTSYPVVHMCVACRCPEWWPMVDLRGEDLLHRVRVARSRSGLCLESEAFNRRWRVSTTDQEHAVLLLTPELQSALARSPAGESWSIGGGGCVSAAGRRRGSSLR